MTESPMEQVFARQLDSAAADFKAEDGWEIHSSVPHGQAWVPEPLRSFELDMVARRGDEFVVVEFRSRRSLDRNHKNHLYRLAAAVEKVANARLEVYWYGNQPEADPTRDRVLAYIQDAQRMLAAGYISGAVMEAWAGLEGALEYYAEAHGVPLDASAGKMVTAWTLLSQLVSLGLVNERDYDRLAELRNQRNIAAHYGDRDLVVNAADIEYAFDLVERMVNGHYASADQMIEWYVDEHDYPAVPLPEAERASIRTTLAEQFPGTPDADLNETVSRLEHDAAL